MPVSLPRLAHSRHAARPRAAAEMGRGGGFGRIAFRAGIVTGAAQVVKVAVQLASMIVLARWLDPSDFGLIASVSPLVAFIALFQDLGFQQAVIQKQDITAEQLNRVFWVTVAAGAACALTVLAASPAVAWFYGEPKLFWISAASAIPLLMGSLSALPLSLLARRMRFGCLAANDIAAAIAGFAAAAGAAYAGFGYWSLVIGSTVPALASLAMGWMSARWRPGRPDFRLERGVKSFGANLTGFNVVNFFARNADNVMIGKVFGAIELGYYDRAYKLFLAPLTTINAPLSRIMLPILARVQEDKTRLREIYLKVAWTLAAVTIPGVATVATRSEEIVGLLFGHRWMQVAPILAWLALAGMMQPIANSTGWLFISQGRTQAMFRWGIFSSAATVGSIAIGLPWGPGGVAAAYAIVGYAVLLPALTVVVHKVGPIRACDLVHIQGLFTISAALAWILDTRLIHAEGPMSVALTGALNYGAAGILMLCFKTPRAVLFDVLRWAAPKVGKSPRLRGHQPREPSSPCR